MTVYKIQRVPTGYTVSHHTHMWSSPTITTVKEFTRRIDALDNALGRAAKHSIFNGEPVMVVTESGDAFTVSTTT